LPVMLLLGLPQSSRCYTRRYVSLRWKKWNKLPILATRWCTAHFRSRLQRDGRCWRTTGTIKGRSTFISDVSVPYQYLPFSAPNMCECFYLKHARRCFVSDITDTSLTSMNRP
jgi:hypothetical protein